MGIRTPIFSFIIKSEIASTNCCILSKGEGYTTVQQQNRDVPERDCEFSLATITLSPARPRERTTASAALVSPSRTSTVVFLFIRNAMLEIFCILIFKLELESGLSVKKMFFL